MYFSIDIRIIKRIKIHCNYHSPLPNKNIQQITCERNLQFPFFYHLKFKNSFFCTKYILVYNPFHIFEPFKIS